MLIHARTWMNLEDIMRSESRRTKKDKYRMIPFFEKPRVVKFIETETKMTAARGWQGGGMAVLVRWERVLQMDEAMGARLCEHC